MTDIDTARLRELASDDHERGCQMRFCACSCGYDDKTNKALMEAADEIDRLRAELAEVRWALAQCMNSQEREKRDDN